MTKQRVLHVDRLNWSAIQCPHGFTSDAGSPFHRPIEISYSGNIGALTIDVSTRVDLIRLLGKPDFNTTGNFHVYSGEPDYELFGYNCGKAFDAQGGSCLASYYVNVETQRVESFETRSRRYALPGGVRVGMSAAAAASWESRPNLSGCGQGILVTKPKLRILVSTHGGHVRPSDGHVSGGQVDGIVIDHREFGVGATLC